MLVAVEAHQKERACCVVALCQVNLPYRYALVCFFFLRFGMVGVMRPACSVVH